MVFSDQTYSVLVVSAAQKFNEAFAEMLPGSEYYPVRFVGNIAAARREMVNKTYDLVIINAPLPDDFGTRFAIDACNQSGTVALLLAKNPRVRIVATAVSLESVAELTDCLTAFPFAQTEVVSLQTARDRKAGSYHLMSGQNPIYIFTMQGGGETA